MLDMPLGVVQCLERIATALKAQGQNQNALSRLEEAVAIATRSGDRLGLTNVLRRLGHTHIRLSDFVKAAEALSEAIAISRSVGSDYDLIGALDYMGRLKVQLGEYPEAESLFQESVSTARRTGVTGRIATGLQYLGDCFRKQSKLNEAVSALEESCRLWVQHSRPECSRWPASILVDLKSSLGDWDGALFWLDHIIAVSRSLKEYSKVAYRLGQKAEILVKRQRYDEAALHFEAAMLTRMEQGSSGNWERRKIGNQLCAIPKTVMKWERRVPLLCDVRKLQRRQPQLVTAGLKLLIPIGHGEL